MRARMGWLLDLLRVESGTDPYSSMYIYTWLAISGGESD